MKSRRGIGWITVVVSSLLFLVAVSGVFLAHFDAAAKQAHSDSNDRLRVECQIANWPSPVCDRFFP